VLGTVLLVVVTYLALTNIAILFGVEPGSTPTWAVPLAYAVLTLAGAGWALILRRSKPQVYAGIGMGARSGGTGFAGTITPEAQR
jgi:4-amino-4-deoxy-L-arabinose transferase-like glycosyltransferase